MILGRPLNLWLGLVTAGTGFAQVAILFAVPDVDPVQLGVLMGAFALLLGSVITLIANQPPTVNQGDTITVVTPAGTPNETRTVR